MRSPNCLKESSDELSPQAAKRTIRWVVPGSIEIYDNRGRQAKIKEVAQSTHMRVGWFKPQFNLRLADITIRSMRDELSTTRGEVGDLSSRKPSMFSPRHSTIFERSLRRMRRSLTFVLAKLEAGDK
ncbi:hypothetical protein HAX54_036003, partial [Datura stramonium]|nr:hypothetical protein [Datura stramonium]